MNIDQLCSIMTSNLIAPPIDRLAAVFAKILNDDDLTCLEHSYGEYIKAMSDLAWKRNNGKNAGNCLANSSFRF